jgi:hypothetical protein
MANAAKKALCTKVALSPSGQRSSGRNPVCFASRASIFGPISSPSWNANTTSAQPCR